MPGPKPTLREIRLAAGLTAHEAAKLADVSENTLARYEVAPDSCARKTKAILAPFYVKLEAQTKAKPRAAGVSR